MKLRDLLKDTPRFSREIPIGMEIDVLGEPALLLGLVQTKDPWGGHPLSQLCVLRETGAWDEEDWDEVETEKMTNRQFLIERMKADIDLSLVEIEKFIINGREFFVEDSEENFMEEENHFIVLLLKYFVQKDKIPSTWLGKDVESLMLVQYDMPAEIYQVNWDADILRIQVETEEIVEEVLIGKQIKCTCGRYDVPKLFHFTGKEGKTHELLIHGLLLFNPWESLDDEEEISDLEEFLGENDRLLVVEYEAEEDLQLQFFTKEYLDTDFVEDWLLHDPTMPEQENNHIRRCALDIVSADFDEEVEIELLSYYESEE